MHAGHPADWRTSLGCIGLEPCCDQILGRLWFVCAVFWMGTELSCSSWLWAAYQDLYSSREMSFHCWVIGVQGQILHLEFGLMLGFILCSIASELQSLICNWKLCKQTQDYCSKASVRFSGGGQVSPSLHVSSVILPAMGMVVEQAVCHLIAVGALSWTQSDDGLS